MLSKFTAKRMLTAALSSAFALSATFAAPVSALALTSDSSVVNTGDHADINSTSEQSTRVDVVNTNVANISQKVNSYANTGGNSADGNIGGGVSIRTGNAVSGVSMEAHANENMTGISGLGNNTGINMLDVVNSGDHADVDSSVKNYTTVNVVNTNTANVKQALNSHTNTGDNKADENISPYGGVSMWTGNATTQAEFGVQVNKNQTGLTLSNLGGALGSDSVVTNTGDHADVDTRTSSYTNLSVANVNAASIYQLMNVSSNTGHNKSTENVGESHMSTGNASTLAEFMANANKNTTGIGGQQAGQSLNLGDVVNTGDKLDSSSQMKTKVYTSVANSNSLTDVSVFTQKSNTGYNKVDDNISADPIMTGGAGAAGAMSSSGNHNTTVFGSTADVLALWLLGSM